jgi:hypothetical protein
MQALSSIRVSCGAGDGRIVLTRHCVVEVVGTHPFVVEATAGRIWLTCEREPHDDVLDAGQRLCLPADRKVYLSGLPTGTARLTDPSSFASTDDDA